MKIDLKYSYPVILLVALLNVTSSYSQDYTPMLDTANEWQLTYNSNGLYTDTYYTDGDTLVDNKTYKILDGYHYISRTFLLREVENEQKVYLNIVDPNGNTEYLLYDFSMEVGDSIDMKNPITPFPENAGYYTVNSISLEPLVDGNLYRHYFLSPSTSNTTSSHDALWVEGVGSLSMVTAPSGDPDVNGVGILSCYFKNAEAFYADGHFPDPCVPNIALNIPDVNLPLHTIQFIHNASGEYQLVHAEAAKEITLYNLSGQKVDTFKNNGASHISLNLSHYASGLYLLTAKDAYNHSQVLKIRIE